MLTRESLSAALARIDGRGYKAYKSIAGAYRIDRASAPSALLLFIDHVQGDPFASPSKLRLRLPHAIPPDLFSTPVRRVALEDFLARRLRKAIPARRGRRGTGKSGLVTIDAGGQEVLERTAAVVTESWVEARIEVGLPAAGRSILGREASRLLLEELPRLAQDGLATPVGDEGAHFVDTVDNHAHLVAQLEARNLVAFVADGACLPRASGTSELPLVDAVAFSSPDSLRVTLDVPHAVDGKTSLSGMGVPSGVTLIVGGGYHGKSTLLKALERGVYPHVPGDGREYVATRRDATKIRAEDGRRVERVDISPFIRELPMGRSTTSFSTEDASGSTSQAANIMEALEVGASLLLLDEDTSATNFMVRDARMQALVAREDEPIVPFVDRVGELRDRLAVSTVLVMGGSGDYFEVADTVVRMRDYEPEEVTAEAKRVAAERPTGRGREVADAIELGPGRRPVPSSIDASRGRREVKIEARGRDALVFGEEIVDLRAVEQLVDPSQLRAVGYAARLAVDRFRADGESLTLRELLARLEALLDERGLDCLSPFGREEEHPGNFARPRRFEIAAAVNRLRSLRVR